MTNHKEETLAKFKEILDHHLRGLRLKVESEFGKASFEQRGAAQSPLLT